MEITISAVELYFLGKLLDAKYIDYAYIAAMDDVQDKYLLRSKEAVASLVNKGMIDEDFLGNLSVSDDVRSLLIPIFFGEMESSVDVCSLMNPKHVDVYKFHFHDDRITLVTGKQHDLLIRQVDTTYFEKLIDELTRDVIDEGNTLTEIQIEKVKRFIAIKLVKLNDSSFVETFVDIDSVLYYELEDGLLHSIIKKEFCSKVVSVLRGEINGI